MKCSLFFVMQIANPDRTTETQLFRDCLAQAIYAEELGYHGVWATEHHGLYEFSHGSAPEVFLSFVAARTRRIRLGHGVTLLPHRYNHPIRVAERLATLDILSGGRVEWGSGKSSTLVEQHAFGNDVDTLDEQWREAIEIIPRMWQSDVFSHQGRFFTIPPTQITPKPIQAPHPPMCGACSKPESAARVGALGLGALSFAFGDDRSLAAQIREYRRAVAAASPLGREKNDHFACTPGALVLHDDRKACAYGLRGARFFVSSMARYAMGGDRPVGLLDVPRGPLSDTELAQAMALRHRSGSSAAIVGDPAAAREALSRLAATGVDEVILLMQMGTVPHEIVMESMRTFAEAVMPHFA